MALIEIGRKILSCTRDWGAAALVIVVLTWAARADAQTCTWGDEIAPATRQAVESAGRRYFELAAKGDVATLKQSAIPSVAANFAPIETAVKDHQAGFAGAQVKVRPLFLLDVDSKEPLPRAEFLCGVFGKSGQTADSAVFVIPDMPPGSYAAVILDVAAENEQTLSFVLQKLGSDWKLAGFYAKPARVAGHDGRWFWDRAREFKDKGQNMNAWFYYNQARDLLAPVPFMSTLATDKIYDESQAIQPSGLPKNGAPIELSGGGKTYSITNMFAVGVGGDVDLVVKHQAPDVSNPNQTYQENVAVIRALVAKYPELRTGFTAVIARAVEPSGKDFGTLMPVKDVK